MPDISMKLDTNLKGRLRNTSLPYNSGLLPMFEAVANSIHSIEEAGLAPNRGKISIEIMRDTQTKFGLQTNSKKSGPEAVGEIVGFKVIDNGIGFNDINMKSFLTLDSEHKADKGGRGVGRLLWLKAFKNVNITSAYKSQKGELKSRSFKFNANYGVFDQKIENLASRRNTTTTIHLDGYQKKYREASLKTTIAIAKSLFEHCLYYFVRQGGAPNIIIYGHDETISLDDVYSQHMASSAVADEIEIKKKSFDLIHIKLRANSSKTHYAAFCAANRMVKEESLKGKIPGLYGNLNDSSGEFIYACYISSQFLDDNVRSERTGFEIDEQPMEMFVDTDISWNDIKEGVVAKAVEHLSEYLEENKKKGRSRIESFVNTKKPRYRPILARIPEDKLILDPNISDKDLDLALHKHLAEIEGKLLSEGHDVMNPKIGEDLSDYQKRLNDYLKTAEDIKKSDLANYVSHRKVILDLLEKAIQIGVDNKYAREDLIHNLIMPMRTDSNGVMLDSTNLWLIDERLAFHDYLASDKPICSMPITNSSEKKKPDICALNVFDNPVLVSEGSKLPLASIVIVEIKRPMRNDAAQGEDKDPIEQAYGYLERIREGKVQTASGRPIPKSDNIPGFCYVICDITPSIEKRCKMHDAIRTDDGLGYFLYNKMFGAYVELVSFDRLVNAAKERNRAFFDKLGLPTN